MDALYPLGTGSVCNNEEIKNSIRLLRKHCKIDRVFIVGENPHIEDTIVIPFKETMTRTKNVFRKIVLTCEETDISEDFFFMNDDFFILKDLDVENYPLYHSGEIPNYQNQTSYLRQITNTKHFLLTYNKPILHFGVHCPIIYNKSKILEIDKFYWQYVNSNNLELNPRVIYGNWFDHKNKKYTKDLKIVNDYPMEDLKIMLKDKEWFSIGSMSFFGNIRKFTEEL